MNTRDLVKNFIDNIVSEWHKKEQDVSLREHLGMTVEEYSQWLLDEDNIFKIMAEQE